MVKTIAREVIPYLVILVLGYFLIVNVFDLRKEVQPYKVFHEYIMVDQPSNRNLF